MHTIKLLLRPHRTTGVDELLSLLPLPPYRQCCYFYCYWQCQWHWLLLLLPLPLPLCYYHIHWLCNEQLLLLLIPLLLLSLTATATTPATATDWYCHCQGILLPLAPLNSLNSAATTFAATGTATDTATATAATDRFRLCQRPREAEKRDPGNEVAILSIVIGSPRTNLSRNRRALLRVL